MIFDGSQINIGYGAQAEVLLYKGYAYKVYKSSYPVEWIEFEKKQQKAVNVAELCNVKYYDTADPHIVKMDYIDGDTLEKRARSGDISCFYTLSDAFRLVHGKNASNINIPHFSDTAGMGLNDSDKTEVLSIISRLSDKMESCVCHLDMHFLNILLPKDSHDFIIIDWMNARLAPLVFDYARTYIIFEEFSKEGLDAYKQIVLPKLWDYGVDENDFCDAKRVCSIIRNREKRLELSINK